MNSLRLITELPVPDVLIDYEPLVRKKGGRVGSYFGLHVFHRPDQATLRLLKDRVADCMSRGLNVGIYPADFKPKLIVFSLSQSPLLKETNPLHFGAFNRFCLQLSVRCLAFSAKGQVIGNLPFELSESARTHDELLFYEYERNNLQLLTEDGKALWLKTFAVKNDILLKEIVLVSEEDCDAEIIDEAGIFISFSSQHGLLNKASGMTTFRDCSFLAHLIFGRDLGSFRNWKST